MINVTLPDGTVNEYAAGITCAEVITDALGKKNGCLAALVDGQEKDMSHEIHHSCKVEGIKAESDAGMYILRHSTAHLLAQAVTELYPDAKPTIGPAIDRGFYYDFAMEPITEADLKPIQKKMQELQIHLTQRESQVMVSKQVVFHMKILTNYAKVSTTLLNKLDMVNLIF